MCTGEYVPTLKSSVSLGEDVVEKRMYGDHCSSSVGTSVDTGEICRHWDFTQTNEVVRL